MSQLLTLDEMKRQLGLLQSKRNERLNVYKMVSELKLSSRTKSGTIPVVIMDVWVEVSWDEAIILMEKQYTKLDIECAKFAEELGIRHEIVKLNIIGIE